MERLYGLVVFGLGTAILWDGRSLSFGSFRSPGSGMFPVLIAVLMLFLSLLLIVFPRKREGTGQSVSRKSIGRLSAVFVALLLYAFLLESLGFLIVSFLLTTLLFAVFGFQRYWQSVLRAIVSTGLAYALFELILKSNLPKGVFGF